MTTTARRIGLVVPALVGMLVVGAGIGWLVRGNGSTTASASTSQAVAAPVITVSMADAGFAREMAVHHAQAVDMADRIRQRTDDPDLRLLATDIVLTQQSQIGRFQGWLEQWGLPQSSTDPVMGWMHEGKLMARHDHHDGATADGDQHEGEPSEEWDVTMPGLATPAQVAALSTAPLVEAERSFFELMIKHHEGGVEMAKGVVSRSTRAEVVRLARSMIASQQSEIDVMREMLAKR